jgi:hypothetical protein
VIEVVLNPARAQGSNGEIYPFPRLTVRSNYSRIGIARVRVHRRAEAKV